MDEDQQRRFALADDLRRGHRSSSRRRGAITVAVFAVLLACVAAGSAYQFATGDDSEDVAAVPRNATDRYSFVHTPADGEADVTIRLWEDFLCPSCGEFEDRSGDYLREALDDGRINLEYHPFVFLLEASTDRYAQRAGNAAACVGDAAGAEAYSAFHDTLMQRQPDEGRDGHDDEQLITWAEKAGADDVADCIRDETFTPWIEEALKAGRKLEVTSTPTVRIGNVTIVAGGDGDAIPGPDELEIAISAAED